ncbi:hypothetical protein Tco_0075968 [Tanacetum coccineum]
MSNMSEDIQCAGSDTRPPMLDRTDFESWQQRIRMYCLGKDNGENIMKSINEGPFHMGTVSDVLAGGTEGAVQQGPVRDRVLNDLSAEEKERYKADIRAKLAGGILRQLAEHNSLPSNPLRRICLIKPPLSFQTARQTAGKQLAGKQLAGKQTAGKQLAA